jgi:hypothetical protein
MNQGTPSLSFAPEANVFFRETALPFESAIKGWLSDNPNYYEISNNRSSRSAIFKRSCTPGTSSTPSVELVEAIARKLLKCPKCNCQVSAAENYKAKFTEGPQANRTVVSDEVTLVCYKCGSETRVDNWKDHLTETGKSVFALH